MNGIDDITTAITALDTDAEITVRGDTFDSIEWLDSNPNSITWEQIQAKQAELTTAYNNQAYQRNRKTEYPTIGDQLDALYHAGVFPTDMANAIKAIKDKYPKE